MNQDPINQSSSEQLDPISQRIALLRQEKNVSQTELAARLGMERTNYRRMELRGQQLSYSLLSRIAQALDVPLLQLLPEGNVSPDQLEIERLRQRSAELTDRLADKQNLLTTQQHQRSALRTNLERSLLRMASVAWTGGLADPKAPALESFLNPQLVRVGLERFGGLSEEGQLLGRPVSGEQLVYLALHVSVFEPAFFQLVNQLAEWQLIDPASLYARAFGYVSQQADG
jgi:transcriptional regulator with XRE-family HTH domain